MPVSISQKVRSLSRITYHFRKSIRVVIYFSKSFNQQLVRGESRASSCLPDLSNLIHISSPTGLRGRFPFFAEPFSLPVTLPGRKPVSTTFAFDSEIKMGCSSSRLKCDIRAEHERSDGYRIGQSGYGFALSKCCNVEREFGENYDNEPFLRPCRFRKCKKCNRVRDCILDDKEGLSHLPCSACGKSQ